ncbi:MAG TPA: MFS transporter [Candidatus Krumholzibacteria bacterium]|nr:MFS transporter [Candidatus Krumholzibacteria bacterium]
MSVFFFWGFVAASNTVLIPLFKQHFHLMQWQSQLVDFAFYIAYTVGALTYFLISFHAGDPLNRIGYKKGLILGLSISALGALGFVPAAGLESYPLMLTSLFVVALGFALQQIVANPYVIALGSPETGAHRASLAQGINSFGTTIGPLLLSYAILGNVAGSADVGLDAVRVPYLILCGAFLAFALVLGLSPLPRVSPTEIVRRDLGAFRHPQLVLGMIAIFVYVGTEVTIQSNLPELMRQPNMLGLGHESTVHFVSLYWGSLMIGRWTGAIGVFTRSTRLRRILTVLVPLAAFGVLLGVNAIKLGATGHPERLVDLYRYLPFVGILIAGFFLAGQRPARTMMLFGAMAAAMMVVGLATEGRLSLYAFVSGGLFCSVMWPCIFALSIAGLGEYTNQGSSLLVMMILGGALLPPVQGYLADWIHIHTSYIIPLLGFSYLAFYGWKVGRVLRAQGIDYDATVGGGH